MRFANEGYLRKRSIATLPYAPASRLKPPAWNATVRVSAEAAMHFAEDREAAFYLVPSLPLYKPTLSEVKAFQESHHHAFDWARGRSARPVYAYVGASAAILKSPFAVFERLLDRPFDGVYVQPLRLHPRQDSVEALVAYVSFLLEAKRYRLRVVAGRAGTFGLVLMALGVDAVDSGLGERETFDLGALDREAPARQSRERSGGRQRTVYLVPLMTSVPEPSAKRILRHPALRSRFICEEGECRYLDLEAQTDNPRAHFFHSRPAELSELRSRETLELRVQFIGQRLRSASELAMTVNRVLEQDGQPPLSLGHLQVWASVLTRMAAVLATRSNE
jgi:hypothetical protein